MIRLMILIAAVLGIAACASSGTEPPPPIAKAEPAEPNSESTSGEVEVVAVPTVPQAVIPVESDVVCRREKKTGTNRSVKVCRKRSEENSKIPDAKKTFEDLRRSQVEYP